MDAPPPDRRGPGARGRGSPKSVPALLRPSGPPGGEVWIGLVEVKPRPGSQVLQGAAGAYTTALAHARDAASFEAQVRAALDALGLTWVEGEDVEPLEQRRAREQVTEEVLAAAEEVRHARTVRLLTFHTWQEE